MLGFGAFAGFGAGSGFGLLAAALFVALIFTGIAYVDLLEMNDDFFDVGFAGLCPPSAVDRHGAFCTSR